MGDRMTAKDMASVILPTSNRYPVALENIENILAQSYNPIEVIVCDDSDKMYYQAEGKAFQESLKKWPNVKYVYCARFDHLGNKDYGLARARNFGVIESQGQYTILLDDRITPAQPDMIAVFVKRLSEGDKIWCFGDKGGNKSSFVENCSAILRHHLVDAGMFCERIDKYGGMTRELHGRFSRQGFKFVYLPDAKAKQVCKSRGWDKKPAQIEEMKKLVQRMTAR